MEISEIIEFFRTRKFFLKEKFAVKKIGVFGSYSKCKEEDVSDIDIYVEFNIEELTLDKYLSLIEYFEKIFGRKVDLITKEGVESIRIPEIKKDIKESIKYA
ncbi:MAG: nucleotidyltransferase domain-containing protein [Candidatus Omnitrophica bacterium]|nr:nucleotidyltransferase domain-containing protein [Candidatus Omnitrophota bacterium]